MSNRYSQIWNTGQTSDLSERRVSHDDRELSSFQDTGQPYCRSQPQGY